MRWGALVDSRRYRDARSLEQDICIILSYPLQTSIVVYLIVNGHHVPYILDMIVSISDEFQCRIEFL